jgi:acylphosphatase
VIRRRVTVSGRVQGVFFRETVRRRALSTRVGGWIRNNPDGTVEAVFEGDAGAVDALVEACRRGPGHAEVERLEIADETPEGLHGFQVR